MIRVVALAALLSGCGVLRDMGDIGCDVLVASCTVRTIRGQQPVTLAPPPAPIERVDPCPYRRPRCPLPCER